MTFRLPKEAVGRRVDVLLQNIPTVTLKIKSVSDEEVIGDYIDGEEWHLNQSFIMAWTYPTRKEMSEEKKAKILAKRRATIARQNEASLSVVKEAR